MAESGIERIMAEQGQRVESDPRRVPAAAHERTDSGHSRQAQAADAPSEQSTSGPIDPSSIDSEFIDVKLDSESLTAISTTLNLLTQVV